MYKKYCLEKKGLRKPREDLMGSEQQRENEGIWLH